MKIATFNVNGINGRLDALLTWLDEAKPDIVCLQETKCADEKFPKGAIARAGYGAVFAGESAYNGVAILARGAEPVLTRASLPGDPRDKQKRYIEAAVGGVLVACLYLPNGNPQPGPKFTYKLAWFERLMAHAAMLKKSGLPVVLAGDYNVVPTEKDIYETTSYDDNALVQPESRAAYRKLLRAGWTDCIATLFPDETVYTFWDYLRRRWERNAGLRIDHILISADLKPRLAAAGVDRKVRGRAHASDHAPVWIKLKDEPAAKKAPAPKKPAKKAAKKTRKPAVGGALAPPAPLRRRRAPS